MNTSSARRRLGFTLIELLVVIAIITILIALLVGGVMALMRKGPETISKNEIGQLSMSLDQFKAVYKQYPPSQIILRPTMSSYNMGNKLEADSAGWIQTFWPNISTTKTLMWLGPSTTPTGALLLEGDQCLVFFLGGPPNGSGGVGGFANDPTDPTNWSVAANNRKSFYTFDAGRLKIFPGGSRGAFPSYIDGWGKLPYVYFGSGKRADGYDPLLNLGFPAKVTPFNVHPYYAVAGTATSPPSGYYNPTKFQLISAGPDGAGSGGFGSGGQWSPTTASAVGALGRDDVSNFYDKSLGSQ